MRFNEVEIHHYFIYSRALAFTGCTRDFVIARLGNAFALSPLSRAGGAALDQGSALDFGYELDYVV